MNPALDLPVPLNSFAIDVPARQYYDFHLPEGSTYPLRGVTYPVDYGHIPGYTTEDKCELDLFVGTEKDGLCGAIVVSRGKDAPNECKFYVALSVEELEGIVSQLKPVLITQQSYPSIDELLTNIEAYKDKP